MKKFIFLLGLILLIAACQPTQPITITENISLTPQEEDNQTQQDITESQAAYVITATEGELVRIPVEAYDPDGGEVELTFEEPFDADGYWLTSIGDEGRYLVRIRATDGILTSTERVLIIINRANRPPVIECPQELTVREGQTVELECNIFDPEGEPVTIGYEGWMQSPTRETSFGDRGTHTVLVRANDGELTSTKEVTINVQRVNRPPVIESLSDKQVLETETIIIRPQVSDPDGDQVIVRYSAPFDQTGTFTPNYGDRGIYTVTVTASDGELETTETFDLEVLAKNRPPVLQPIEPITVNEGELVRIPVEAYDPDGDEITISFSGWMSSQEYQTTYEDAYPRGCNERGCTATYTTIVTVSDGKLQTSQEVQINVVDTNRPPEFIFG